MTYLHMCLRNHLHDKISKYIHDPRKFPHAPL